MNSQLPSSWKACVVCEFWGGQRKPDAFKRNVVFDQKNDKGECLGGGFDKRQVSARQSCHKFSKWGVLK